jgi:hypothetical protein
MVQLVTAFSVYVHQDGRVTAQPIDSDAIAIARPANELDIKQACQEVLDAVHLNQIARVVASVVTATPESDSDKTSRIMRQSLLEKGIL